MSDSTGQSAQPGWYADPSGAPQHRWWDGSRWTEHVHVPEQQPADPQSTVPEQPGFQAQQTQWQPVNAADHTSENRSASQPARQAPTSWPQQNRQPQVNWEAWQQGTVGADTPVYNWYFWVVILLPLLSTAAYLAFDLSGFMIRSMAGVVTLDSSYLLVVLSGFVVFVATIVFAYFDYRKLEQDGIRRPFHWAWTFLSSIIYVIGRCIIVKRRSGRGLAILWAWAAVSAFTIVVAVVKVLDAVVAMMPYLPNVPH